MLPGMLEGRDAGPVATVPADFRGCSLARAVHTPAERTLQGAAGPVWISSPMGSAEHTCPTGQAPAKVLSVRRECHLQAAAGGAAHVHTHGNRNALSPDEPQRQARTFSSHINKNKNKQVKLT